jgi:hypothetical protein
MEVLRRTGTISQEIARRLSGMSIRRNPTNLNFSICNVKGESLNQDGFVPPAPWLAAIDWALKVAADIESSSLATRGRNSLLGSFPPPLAAATYGYRICFLCALQLIF